MLVAVDVPGMSTRQVSSLPGRSLVGAVRAAVRAVSGVGFWFAVLAPFAYLPLLAVGLESRQVQFAFVALFVANVVALYVGRGHGRDRDAGTGDAGTERPEHAAGRTESGSEWITSDD